MGALDDTSVTDSPLGVCDVDVVEERREARKLRHWLVKTLTLCFVFAFLLSIASMLYTVVIQGKNFDTTFIGETFEQIFKVLHYLLV